MAEAKTQISDPGKLVVTKGVKSLYSILMFIGVLGFLGTLFTDKQRAWEAYLVGFFFFTTMGVGGLFFTALQHVVRAGWSVNVRRICESFTALLPWALFFAIGLLIGGAPELYSWLDTSHVATDHLLQHKSGYLNAPFFWVRMIVFIGAWILFAKKIVGESLKQDISGDENINHRLVPISVACVLFFGISYSLFSIDTLMSLAPHWFSTIFGIYTFSGLFQAVMAAMILIILYLKKQGLLEGFVNDNHLHDLGKFLFGFTVFWAYIAFSQYMLIWYANMPEETIFYIPRSEGHWVPVSIALILFKFVVPFFALLPRWAKRNPVHLAAVSILILIMEYVDIYWLVYPTFHKEGPVFSIQEVSIFLGFLGVFIFAVTRFLSKNAVVPYRDGRIHESMNHEVIY